MLGLVDLKAEIAACSKVSWRVDPLPLIVPLAAAADDEVAAGAVPPWKRKMSSS
jgi:hypothetical protein